MHCMVVLQDLKGDEDEMLRGVGWGAVARYVDLSEELQQFNGSALHGGGRGSSGGAAASDGAAGPALAPGDPQQPEAEHPQRALDRLAAQQQGAAVPEALQHQDELFESAGWAAPSSPRASAKTRRADALADLG